MALFNADRVTDRAQREADNRQQMDIIMAAYNRYLENLQAPVVSGPMPRTVVGKKLYDTFVARVEEPIEEEKSKNKKKKKKEESTDDEVKITPGFTISERERGADEFLFNARTPEELLTMAGIEKPKKWKPYYYTYDRKKGKVIQETDDDYSRKLHAANKLFESAKATSLTGGSSFFNFATPTEEEELNKRYDFNKFLPAITEELQNKYSALGGYQRGLLANETVETSDDEKVLWKTNPAMAVEAEIKALQSTFKDVTKKINEEFTRYSQSQRKLGTYQSAALSEEQMMQALGQQIRSTYTTFGGQAEDSYIGNQYMSPVDKNIDLENFNIQDYISGLPKLRTIQ